MTEMVKEILENELPKLGQNVIYDIQYSLEYGIFPNNVIEDTMLLHHALYPELPKGLAFLASVHTNSPAWKHMRKESNKRDE